MAVLNYSSNKEHASLGGLNIIIVVFIIQLIIPLIGSFLGVGRYREQVFSPAISFMSLPILWERSALIVNFFAGNFVFIHDNSNETGNEEKVMANEAGKEKQQLFKSVLENYLSIEKPYLNSELKITNLAKALGTNRTYLSAFINETYNMNFCRFVNTYPITEYEQLRTREANKKLSNNE